MSAVIISKLSKRFPNCAICSFALQGGLTSYTSILTSLVIRVFTVPIKNYSDTNQNIGSKPILRLLTKDNCSLCEDAKQILLSSPGRFDKRLVLKEIDILKEGNEELFDLYRYEIPVFFLGRTFISKNRINLEKLEQELGKLEESEK